MLWLLVVSQTMGYLQNVCLGNVWEDFVQVESVRHPSGEESKRHMLQQDGCTGDAVFLTYKTVCL